MKYKSPKQVMITLLDGGKLKSMRDLKYKYKNSLPEYSKLISDGISMYEEYIIDQDLRSYIDPEDMMTTQEYEDRVGFKG